MTPFQKEKQAHFFRLIDVDDNKFMEMEDFVTIGNRLASERGIKEGSEDYKRIQQAVAGMWEALSPYVSSGDSGKVTLDEWVKFIDDKVIKMDESVFTEYVQLVINGMFEILDHNENHVIDAWEYIQFLKCFGVPDGMAHAAFTTLDWDGNGEIDEHELERNVRNWFKSDDRNVRGNALFGPLDWFEYAV
jgi:Ca2+-binding EF-hand superfamily protein